jgi:hypothetical protein
MLSFLAPCYHELNPFPAEGIQCYIVTLQVRRLCVGEVHA